ncbi:DUF6354 family protein [Kitasatospora aureofaciens]|uniref:DUF6354 family protein n=1 Tax=Kitasatospora aureofaciens TaxID=1894 RepID=UPI0034072A28
MTEQPVRPGQVWADNDKRNVGRTIRIESVDNTHATVTLVTASRDDIQGARPKRTSRIRLDRFRPTSTGYRLIRDAQEGQQ